MKTKIILCIAVALAVCLPLDAAAQCAMCRASLESSINDPNSVAKGINKGILYIMVIPYVLIVFIFRKQIAALYKQSRAGRSMAAKANS